MTVRDLIIDCDIDNTVELLINEYYSDKEDVDLDKASSAYREVMSLLMLEHPAESDDPLILFIEEPDEECPECGKAVLGISKGDGQRYALDFIDWVEILASDVNQDTIDRYGIDETVAHILYEITFYGFTRKQVLDKSAQLLDDAKDAKEDSPQNGG